MSFKWSVIVTFVVQLAIVLVDKASGFVVLKRNTTRFNTGISLRDALADYIRTLGQVPLAPDQKTDPPAPAARCLDLSRWRNLVGGGDVPFDYRNLTCLRPEVQAPDGRIRPVVR